MTVALFVLTDPALPAMETARVIASAVAAAPGKVGVVVRSDDEAICMQIARICHEHGAPCFLKGSAALVARCGASGVHLGGMHAGVTAPAEVAFTTSAHDEADVVRAAGAEAVFVSPIFASPGKGPPRGVAAIARAREAAPSARIYALGGVTLASVAECMHSGADGVAVIRAVLADDDPAAAARAIVRAVVAAK